MLETRQTVNLLLFLEHKERIIVHVAEVFHSRFNTPVIPVLLHQLMTIEELHNPVNIAKNRTSEEAVNALLN